MPRPGYRILDLCARINGHPIQHAELRSLCLGFDQWNHLLSIAEQEGMPPLLYRHLVESSSHFPDSVRRSLFLLQRRHSVQQRLHTQALLEILDRFETAGITALLIKGAALRYQLYPDPALRPMRDIDLLVHPDDANKAQSLLRSSGYKQSTAPIPTDHFHLPSLHQTIGDHPICVEIHRGLFPNCPPYFQLPRFEQLLASSATITLNGRTALTMGPEETFIYLYHHGIRTPLTYESCRLIHLADIIGFVEHYSASPVWKRIMHITPHLARSVPALHHITPWDLDNIPAEIASSALLSKKLKTTAFDGWPRTRLKDYKRQGRSLRELCRDTFFPSCWWLTLYYGADNWFSRLWAIIARHPAQIWWWARLSAQFRNR